MFCTSRRLIRRKRTVTYHGQYFTINSRVSECDHECETRNAEPEIGTDGSSQTRRNPRVDGYGSGFGPPRVCGSGFWPVLEPNRPVFAVQTRTAGELPGPVANTRYTAGSPGHKSYYISKKHFHPGGLAASEDTGTIRAITDTSVGDYSSPGVNATRRVAYRSLIAV
jgi:hypothetical protein